MKPLLVIFSLVFIVFATPAPNSTVSTTPSTNATLSQESPPHDFIATLRTTRGNETKTSTAVVITSTNIIAAPSSAYFDAEVSQNLTYEICYHPEKCVTEFNEKDCRVLKYEYTPGKDFTKEVRDEKQELRVIAIEDIALFELSLERAFEIGKNTKLPIIYPHAKLQEMENLGGYVVGCKGSEVASDFYNVQLTSDPSDDPTCFYTKSQLHDHYRNGAPFIIKGHEDATFLMGIVNPDEKNQFIFVPNCFEKASGSDVDVTIPIDETFRQKRRIERRKFKTSFDQAVEQDWCSIVSTGINSVLQYIKTGFETIKSAYYD